jgi:hypothetical protein
VLYAFARVVGTGKAEFGVLFFATSYFTLQYRYGFACIRCATPITLVFLPKKGHADVAVHPACGYVLNYFQGVTS